MNRQWRWAIVFILLLGLGTLACGPLDSLPFIGGDEEEPATEEASAADGDSITEESQAEEPVEADDSAAAPASGDAVDSSTGSGEPPQTLNLSELANFGQPADLNSFRVNFEMRFESTSADGTVESASLIGTGAQSIDPPATTMAITVEGVEDLGPGQKMSFTRIENTDYISLPDGICLSNAVGEAVTPFSDLMDSGNFVEGVEGAELVERNVEINGVNTNHYHFDESSAAISDPTLGDLDEVSGDIYIAESGYVVRVTMSGKGTSGLFSDADTLETEVYFEQNYSNFGEPVKIEAPADCDSAGETEFPILEDASEQTTFEGFITYKTGVPFADAVSFYREEMAAAGWAATQEFVSEPTASFVFTKDDREVQINIVEDGISDKFIIAIVES